MVLLWFQDEFDLNFWIPTFFPLSGFGPVPVFVQVWMKRHMTFWKLWVILLSLNFPCWIALALHNKLHSAWMTQARSRQCLSCLWVYVWEPVWEAVVWQLRNAETSLCFSFLISVWHTHTHALNKWHSDIQRQKGKKILSRGNYHNRPSCIYRSTNVSTRRPFILSIIIKLPVLPPFFLPIKEYTHWLFFSNCWQFIFLTELNIFFL